MEDNEKPGRIGQTAQDLKDYAQLYADSLKLGLVENLSTLSNTLFGVLLLVVLLGIAALFFAIALTWVIGMMIGSMLGAVALMGGVFVVLALVVLALRKRLVTDQMIRIFSRMMYDLNKRIPGDE